MQYNMVPFRVRADWLFLGVESVLVPITIKIDNNQLTYWESLGIQRATVNVYGSVRSLQGVIAAEFEEVLTADYTPETVAYKSFQNSVYQKQVVLKPGLGRVPLQGWAAGKYQIRIEIRDRLSGGKASTTASFDVTTPGLTTSK
jgi:hypothetical protein